MNKPVYQIYQVSHSCRAAGKIKDVYPLSLCLYITKGRTKDPVVNCSMHFLSSISAVSTIDIKVMLHVFLLTSQTQGHLST